MLILSCNSDTKTDTLSKLSADETKNLAKEAWLFGMPLVMFEKQIDYSTHVTEPEETRSPINQFVHYRKFVDASNRYCRIQRRQPLLARLDRPQI